MFAQNQELYVDLYYKDLCQNNNNSKSCHALHQIKSNLYIIVKEA